jgi:type IV pilus biogenesis protein CpaD/CtpE
MRWKHSLFVLAAAAVLLSGCSNPFAEAPAPDYRIRLETMPDGQLAAVPPECPDWRTSVPGPFQNEPWPQYGCANTRNLASMVERPEDLVAGRDSGQASSETAAGSMERYITGKTRALIDPNAKAPVAPSAAGGS